MERIKYIRGVEGRGKEIETLFKNMGVLPAPEGWPINYEWPHLLYFIESDGRIGVTSIQGIQGKTLMAMGEETSLPVNPERFSYR